MMKSKIDKPPEVDLTPMIDVIFQLMIFFMVIMAVAVVYGVAIKFPPPGQKKNDNTKKEKNIVVYVQSDRLEKDHLVIQDGVLKVNGEEMPMTHTLAPQSTDPKEWAQVYADWEAEREQAYDKLELKMRSLLDEGYKKDVLLIQGDMKTYHGKVMRVIDRGKKLEIDGFSLVPPER